jgi:hypothetical protein
LNTNFILIDCLAKVSLGKMKKLFVGQNISVILRKFAVAADIPPASRKQVRSKPITREMKNSDSFKKFFQ